jgi:aspartokinase
LSVLPAKAETALSKIKIGGIVRNSNLACLTLFSASKPVSAYAAFLDALGEAQINVQFIVQGTHKENGNLLIICVDQHDQENALRIIRSIQVARKLHIHSFEADVTCIGVYGPDFRVRPGLAGALMRTLDDAGVEVRSTSTSLSTFSFVVPSSHAEQAMSAIHQVFELP